MRLSYITHPASLVLLFILGLLVVMGNPSLTGLATLDFNEAIIDVHKKFTETSSFPIQLAPPAYRLHATGYAEGSGTTTLRVLSDTSSYVLFTETFKGTGKRFSSCGDLCSIDLYGTDAVIDVQLDGNVVLYLDNLSYLSDTSNSAPVFIGPSPQFRLQKNEGLTLDLSRFIADPEGDELTFVAITEDPFYVELFEDQLHLSSEFGYVGDGHLMIFASDYEHTTQIDIPLQVVSSTLDDLIPSPLYTETICGNGVCERFENSQNCALDCGTLPLGVQESSFSLPPLAWLLIGLGLLFFVIARSLHHEPKKSVTKKSSTRLKKKQKNSKKRKKK